MNIYEKLANVQSELVAPKGQYNSFGKYKYRSCEDILTAVKPILKKHGLTLVLADEILEINGRFYIRANAKVLDFEGNSIENTALAREDETKKGMDGSQITGTASSYARKYALNGLFAIDDNKDADTDEYHKQTEAPQKAAKKADDKPSKPAVICLNCNQPVLSVRKNGKVIEPEEILEKCGGVCMTCYKEAKEAMKNKNSDIEEIK